MVGEKRSMTFLEAAKAVLEETKVPMHFKRITETAIQKKYLRTGGKTPEWTMGARLSVDVKEKGPESEFNRIDSGRYGLSRWKRGKVSLHRRAAEEEGPRYWLVSVEPENYAADVETNRLDTVGVKVRMFRTLEKTKPGDLMVLYVKKVARFGAIVEISGNAYKDGSLRWPVGATLLAARIPCKPISVAKNDVDARHLYTQLSVFNQYPAKHRTLALRNGITEISKQDFDTIERSMT